MATTQSMSPWSVTPASCSSLTSCPSASSASAYDSGEGVKPGRCRWKSSSYRAWSSTAKATNRAQVLLQRGAGIGGEVECVQPLEQLPVAVGEHGVVESVLRVEVLVQGRLAHPDGASQRMQGDPADSRAPEPAPTPLPRSRPSSLLASSSPCRPSVAGDLAGRDCRRSHHRRTAAEPPGASRRRPPARQLRRPRLPRFCGQIVAMRVSQGVVLAVSSRRFEHVVAVHVPLLLSARFFPVSYH